MVFSITENKYLYMPGQWFLRVSWYLRTDTRGLYSSGTTFYQSGCKRRSSLEPLCQQRHRKRSPVKRMGKRRLDISRKRSVSPLLFHLNLTLVYLQVSGSRLMPHRHLSLHFLAPPISTRVRRISIRSCRL